MGTLYQCDTCQKIVPLDDYNDLELKFGGVNIYEFNLCNECMFDLFQIMIKQFKQKSPQYPLNTWYKQMKAKSKGGE